jgi:polysaccharide chain length determinant protein (PEP-CTERM system associated)
VLPGKKYTPDDIVRLAWRRRWLIAVPVVALTLGTAVVASRLPNKYKSQTTILVVPQRVPESYVRSTVTMRLEDRLEAIKQQTLSRTRLERLVHEFDLYAAMRRYATMEDVVQRMRLDISVQAVKGDAFSVSYISHDPQTALKVTDRLATAFIDESLTDRAVLAESTTSFLQTQLEDARRRLEAQERQLADYKRRHLGELPTERDANLQMLSNLQLQVQSLNDAMSRDRDRRFVLERTLADMADAPAITPPVTPGQDPAAPGSGSAAAQLEAARAQLRSMEVRLRPEHPDVLRLKRVIRDLEAKAQAEALERPLSSGGASSRPTTAEEAARAARMKATQLELVALDRQIGERQNEEKRLRGEMAKYQGRVEATPTRESELTSLTRDYETLQRNYTNLLAKQEDSKVAANLERRQIGEQFRMIDPPRLPERPFSPNRVLIDLGGVILGLAVGVGLVGFLEYRDTSFHKDDDVVRLLSLPVMAVVPVITTRAERRRYRRRVLLALLGVGLVMLVAVGGIAWVLLLRG